MKALRAAIRIGSTPIAVGMKGLSIWRMKAERSGGADRRSSSFDQPLYRLAVRFIVAAFLFQNRLDLLQFRFGQMLDADEFIARRRHGADQFVHFRLDGGAVAILRKNGRASCRERVCQYV